MSNQTIDGVLVSRGLLERIMHSCMFSLSRQQYEELRALLDAKSETVAGHHPACRAVDDYKPGECSHSCKPAAQPQGEPVAFTAVGVLRDDGDGGLAPEWILEGGTAELWAGAVLLIADEDQELCAEDGHCELYRNPLEQPAPVAGVPKSECPNCLGDSMLRCDACIPDFSPGSGNRARRRAESLGLSIPATDTAYDGFDNGVD